MKTVIPNMLVRARAAAADCVECPEVYLGNAGGDDVRAPVRIDVFVDVGDRTLQVVEVLGGPASNERVVNPDTDTRSLRPCSMSRGYPSTPSACVHMLSLTSCSAFLHSAERPQNKQGDSRTRVTAGLASDPVPCDPCQLRSVTGR